MFGHMGRGPKQITERLQQYPSGPYMHEQYSPQYSYEPPNPMQYVPSSPVTSKHGHHGGHKSNAAMSALTLLAFLFFLNILQQCLKDHMSSINTTPIMIMSGGREGEDPLAEASDMVKKVDKTGQSNKPVDGAKPKLAKIDWVTAKADERTDNDKFTKINLAQRDKPRQNGFPGFVSAINKD